MRHAEEGASLNFCRGLLVICTGGDPMGGRWARLSGPIGRNRMCPSCRSTWASGSLLPFVLMTVLLLPLLPSTVEAAGSSRRSAKRTILEFESRLRDENDKPVSGIFPIEDNCKKSLEIVLVAFANCWWSYGGLTPELFQGHGLWSHLHYEPGRR